MVRLFGQDYNRGQLEGMMGDIAQIGGVQVAELADGQERGVRIANFRTGTGFAFTVHLDRGMDIGPAEYCGQALAWRSAAGVVAPAYYEVDGAGWAKGFPGGLMVTCGLTNVGPSSADAGRTFPTHGSISYMPARNVWADGAWHGDHYEMFVQGKVRDAFPFAERFEVARRISAWLGESRLFVTDRLTNVGDTTSPFMLLYHCNVGFPVLDGHAELLSPSRRVRLAGETRTPDRTCYALLEPPQVGYAQQVFYHDMVADSDGFVSVAVVNRQLGSGLGLYVRYRQRELPRFSEWKRMAPGDYVLGLEPCNCLPEGRASERARGELQVLEPGETREHSLEIGVLPDNAAIDRLEIDVGRQVASATR
jgi:hypothetical protein